MKKIISNNLKVPENDINDFLQKNILLCKNGGNICVAYKKNIENTESKKTIGCYLYKIVGEKLVGVTELIFSIDKNHCFLDNIETNQTERNKGYGTTLLAAMEIFASKYITGNKIVIGGIFEPNGEIQSQVKNFYKSNKYNIIMSCNETKILKKIVDKKDLPIILTHAGIRLIDVTKHQEEMCM